MKVNAIAMDSQEVLCVTVKIINQSEELMRKSRGPKFFIFLSFLVTRYSIFAAILLLKLQDALQMLRAGESPRIEGKLFGSLTTFVLPDFVLIPSILLLASLFTLMLIYTVEAGLKEPEITWKNLTIEIWKKQKNAGPAAMLFLCFLSVGYVSFSFSLMLAAMLFRSPLVRFYSLASALTISSAVLLVYFDFVWFQRMLAAVETSREEFTAVEKSEAEIEEEKENAFWAYPLFFLSGIVGCLIMLAMCKFLMGDIASSSARVIFSVNGFLMVALGLAATTLFYLESTSEPAEEIVMQETEIYKRVSSTAPCSEDIP